MGGRGVGETVGEAPRRTGPRMLALLAVAELLAMSVWFTASAVAEGLATRWDPGPGAPARVGGLSAAVNLGFVAGTGVAAVLNLADLLRSRTYFAASAVLAALANAAVLSAPSEAGALAARFATGFLLAGVYPPAMKMAATWFRSSRGLAIGVLVGALTAGKAVPHLIRALPGAGAPEVVLASSAGAVAAAALVGTFYRDGPFAFPRRRFSWGLARTALRHRPTRLATVGYLGHMWELYAVWTWAPVFVAASAEAAGVAPQFGALAGFLLLAAGAPGCVWGGWAADRAGRERVAAWAMAASAACSAGVGFLFGGPFGLLVAAAVVWGFFVVADSAQFSALVTEVAPAGAVGTALTLQTCLGFLLAAATIELVPRVAYSAGWAWAFPLLAVGPVAGIRAIRRLERLRGVRATPSRRPKSGRESRTRPRIPT